MQALFITVLIAFLASATAARPNELVLLGDDKIGQVVKTRVQYKKASALPSHWDYREKGLLTSDLNQHIPVYW